MKTFLEFLENFSPISNMHWLCSYSSVTIQNHPRTGHKAWHHTQTFLAVTFSYRILHVRRASTQVQWAAAKRQLPLLREEGYLHLTWAHTFRILSSAFVAGSPRHAWQCRQLCKHSTMNTRNTQTARLREGSTARKEGKGKEMEVSLQHDEFCAVGAVTQLPYTPSSLPEKSSELNGAHTVSFPFCTYTSPSCPSCFTLGHNTDSQALTGRRGKVGGHCLPARSLTGYPEHRKGWLKHSISIFCSAQGKHLLSLHSHHPSRKKDEVAAITHINSTKLLIRNIT